MTERALKIIVLLFFGIVSIGASAMLTGSAMKRADQALETQENIEVLIQHPTGATARRILGKPDPIEVRIVK